MTKKIIAALCLWAMACGAQTTVNGGRVFTGIVKSSGSTATVDFSGAASTVPVVTGVSVARPATCTPGQMYFATDATAGQNLYYCTAVNTWTQQAVGVSGPTVVQTNQSNTFSTGTQDFSGAAHTLPAKKGTAAGIPATCTVGEAYFATDATAGQNFYYCTAANVWTQVVPVQANQSNTYTAGTQDFSGAAHTLPAVKGAVASKPATCTVGEQYFATDATAGQNLYYCTAANTWIQQAAGGSSLGATVVQTNQSNAYTTGTQDFSGAAHTLPAVKGVATSKPATCTVGEQYFATDAAAGQNLYYCTAANTWTQQVVGGSAGPTVVQTNQSNTFSTGTQDFSAAAHTLFVKKGTAANLPSTCTVGEGYFATDAASGQNLYYCTVTNTWTQQAAGGGSLGATVVQTNQSNAYTAGTQDFSGAAHTLPAKKGTAAAIPSTCTTGEEYFATDATAGQNKYYCTAANTWTPETAGGGGSAGGVSGSLQKNSGGGGLSGQAMIFANIYGGGTERQLGINCTPKASIPYTAFTASATSQQIKVATVPAYWFPSAMLVNEATQFTSGSGTVTALAASMGTLSATSYYVQPFPLLQAGPNFRADNVNGQPASLGSHDIYVQVSVTNVNPGNLGNGTTTNLTAGALEVAVCGGTWQ